MPAWRIEPIWDQRTVVIVGGGASFSAAQARLIAMARAAGAIRVIAVNDAMYPCWFADIGYACDNVWWQHHHGVPGFPGLKLRLRVPDPVSGKDTNHVAFLDIFTIECSGTTGFDPDPRFVRSGGNSGYQMVHLCAHLKAQTVVLVGFDMCGTHWFGEHPEPLSYRTPSFDRRVAEFAELAEAIKPTGMRVVNAARGSALTMFPTVDLAQVLEEARHGA